MTPPVGREPEVTPGCIGGLDEAQLDPQVLRRYEAFRPLRPLNDAYSIVCSQEVIYPQSPGLLRPGDAVEIHMIKPLFILRARILANQDKGRADEPLFGTPPAADALGKARLSGPERPLQTDHVAAPEQSAQASTEPLRLLNAAADELQHMFFKQHHGLVPNEARIVERIIQPLSVLHKQLAESAEWYYNRALCQTRETWNR